MTNFPNKAGPLPQKETKNCLNRASKFTIESTSQIVTFNPNQVVLVIFWNVFPLEILKNVFSFTLKNHNLKNCVFEPKKEKRSLMHYFDS